MRPRLKGLVFVACAAVTLTVAAAAGLTVLAPKRPTVSTTGVADIGGPFRLTTQDGKTLSDADLKGKPYAVFFGFTHCPEVCPTTLWELSQALQKLGPDADRIKVLFVTLDPARDTPELLKTYLASFDPHIVGLTGSEEEIAKLAKAYKVYWRKVPTDNGDYTLDHSAIVYLMDAKGAFTGTIAYQEKEEAQLAKLRSLAEL
ncbi:SCO family protein [Chelatococcus sp. GCM10030263]|uniref:SCO family protein n=1 Tax=Chelatococcus sp. GCM10030263 TaxID=3273387 RepID=UPI00362449DA